MYLYLSSIIIFILANYIVISLVKEHNFKNFFVFTIVFFIFSNIINIYLFKEDLYFSLSVLFSSSTLFLYAGLYRSVSVKIMILLFKKKKSISIENLYKTEFQKNSFDKRVQVLIEDDILQKKGKNFYLTKIGKKYLRILKLIQSIYKIKASG